MPDVREITGTILIAGEDRRDLTGNECELIRRMLCGEVSPPRGDEAFRLTYEDILDFDEDDTVVPPDLLASADAVLASTEGDPELPTTPLAKTLTLPGGATVGVVQTGKTTRVHTPDQNNPSEAARQAARPGGPEGMRGGRLVK